MKNSIIIQENGFVKARKEIRLSQARSILSKIQNKENSGKTIIFTSNDDELNRKILEKEKIDILLINQKGRKDRMKQRDSGFNQVMAKVAKKNNIVIGINLDEIIISERKTKADILARISQNVRLCNKNKLKMKFISLKEKRDNYDIKALGLVLGMPTSMIKNL